MSSKKTLHIIISGRLQGVGFRYFVREKALENDLSGWVRNSPNGTVEIEVEGKQHQLDVFIDFLKLGNGYSRTDKLSCSEINPPRNYTSFQIKY